jgi:N-carbamoylputrescine amidase
MIKLAAIQVSATPDVARNLRKAAQFLEAAAGRGARIACFPELFSLPWFPREERAENFSLAEALDGPVGSRVAQLAESCGIAVICPVFERTADGRYFNSAVVFDARGNRVGQYRKVHVPSIPLWQERFYFSPGDLGFPVWEIEGLKVGIQICWDHFFPEGFRSLALAGAQVVFVPTAAAFASQQRWLGTAVGHAVANGLFVVRVNRVGREPQQDFYGGSFCVRPDGDLASEPIGVNEGVLLIECDPSEVERARRTWPFLGDRRPQEYGAIVSEARPADALSLGDGALQMVAP